MKGWQSVEFAKVFGAGSVSTKQGGWGVQRLYGGGVMLGWSEGLAILVSADV